MEMQKTLFPTFEKEFSDLVEVNELENGENIEHGQDAQDDAKPTPSGAQIDEILLYSLVKEIYLGEFSAAESSTDLLDKYMSQALPLLSLPQVHSSIDFEASTHTTYTLLSGLIQKLTSTKPKDKESFTIYQDHDFSDAITVKDMLLRLEQQIRTLLQEFEEHPALLRIIEVIQRILSFSISSPVMKFLTGLEFLLKEAQNWETYASSHVSLKSHLCEITNVIIKWRKSELNCWPQLLRKSEEKVGCVFTRKLILGSEQRD